MKPLWLLVVLCVSCVPMVASASPNVKGIVGYWKMIHDKTKKPRTVVQVYRAKDGKYYGKIVKLIPYAGEKMRVPRCTKCTGKLKGASFLGFPLIRGLQPEGNALGKGKITDPESGKTYGCKIFLAKKGKQLKVRGYVFFFYRTQTWYRLKSPNEVKGVSL